MKPIYLDYNASTPILPEVQKAMLPFLQEHFGNPSSSHFYGIKTRQALQNARMQIAELLEAEPNEIIFTSGGTESNNLALQGAAFANRDKGNHIITSQIEHPAVMEVCRFLETKGFRISYLPVDEFGTVAVEQLQKELCDETILVSIMHSNNEVGTIQPIREISDILKGKKIIFHTDAAQSIGKIPVSVKDLGVDMLTMAGHKCYAPKGVGVLFVKHNISIQKILHGAEQEKNFRPGTENILEIVGLGKAAELIDYELSTQSQKMLLLKEYFIKKLQQEFPNAKINGHPTKCLPNTINVSFPGFSAADILSQLQNVAASAGAACHSGVTMASAVLQAMKVPAHLAEGAIRFSLGWLTTQAEIEETVVSLKNMIKGNEYETE
jgi:cysteine desulfurase